MASGSEIVKRENFVCLFKYKWSELSNFEAIESKHSLKK